MAVAKKILLGSAVLALFVLFPVAIADFVGVGVAQARPPVAVPEPGTLTLLSAGLVGMVWRLRWRRG